MTVFYGGEGLTAQWEVRRVEDSFGKVWDAAPSRDFVPVFRDHHIQVKRTDITECSINHIEIY